MSRYDACPSGLAFASERMGGLEYSNEDGEKGYESYELPHRFGRRIA